MSPEFKHELMERLINAKPITSEDISKVHGWDADKIAELMHEKVPHVQSL